MGFPLRKRPAASADLQRGRVGKRPARAGESAGEPSASSVLKRPARADEEEEEEEEQGDDDEGEEEEAPIVLKKPAGGEVAGSRAGGQGEYAVAKKPAASEALTEVVRRTRPRVKPFMRKRKGSYKYAPSAAKHKPWHKFLVGTSGFSYPHWRGKFYPEGLHQADEFFHYAEKFNAVELNGTFYGTPDASVWDGWRDRAAKASPGGQKPFLYAVKANQYFTHKKKMHVDEDFTETWNDFWDKCKRLEPHLGCVLFQFPASFHLTMEDGEQRPTLERLEDLGKLLPENGRFAFEFRDPSWYRQPAVLNLFRRHNWCFCLVDVNNKTGWAGRMTSGPSPPPEKYPVTCDWGTYFRFHGLQGQYVGSYGSMLCKRMAHQMYKHTADSGRSAFAFFNNTDDGSPLASALLDANNLQEVARSLLDQ